MLMFQYHSLRSSLLDYMKYYMKILLNSFSILSEKVCLNWAKYGNTFKWPSYPLLSDTKSHRTKHESTCKWLNISFLESLSEVIFLKAKVYFMILCTSHLLTSKYVLISVMPPKPTYVLLLLNLVKWNFRVTLVCSVFLWGAWNCFFESQLFYLFIWTSYSFSCHYYEFSHPYCDSPPPILCKA